MAYPRQPGQPPVESGERRSRAQRFGEAFCALVEHLRRRSPLSSCSKWCVDGEICVLPSSSFARQVLTPARVLRAFQAVEGPASKLIIQPPKGKTLVNFRTNFLTSNTKPTTQTVDGDSVELEVIGAKPTLVGAGYDDRLPGQSVVTTARRRRCR